MCVWKTAQNMMILKLKQCEWSNFNTSVYIGLVLIMLNPSFHFPSKDVINIDSKIRDQINVEHFRIECVFDGAYPIIH